MVLQVCWGFPGGSVAKTPPANTGDTGEASSIPGLGGSSGGGNVTHSNILAWEIPWTEEPDGLQFLGSQRVRHDLVTEYTGTHALGTGMLRYLRSPHLYSAVFFAWNAFPSSNPSPLYIHPIQVCSGIPQQNSTDWVV